MSQLSLIPELTQKGREGAIFTKLSSDIHGTWHTQVPFPRIMSGTAIVGS